MTRLEDLEGNPGRQGLWPGAFVPLSASTPWGSVLAIGTFEDESGLWWCRMKEGPPTMEREVRMKGSETKFRVGRARSSAMGRQGRPGWRLERGHHPRYTHSGREERKDEDVVWVVLVMGVQRMGVRATGDGRGQFMLELRRPQDTQ